MTIRPTSANDIPALQSVVEVAGLFPGELLPAMVSGFLSDDPSDEVWLTCELEGRVVGVCYAVPEKLTEGTWNMLAIAVHPDMQGAGLGSAMTQHLECQLQREGHRLLIADTSGAAAFDRTRDFYRRNGYAEEARIRNFWAAGDDKVIFTKALQPATS